MSEAINTEVLRRAYLETVYWWVDCEYRCHNLFSETKQASNIEELQKLFYSFTKTYSVRRTVEGKGRKATNSLLKDLMDDSFIEQAINGNLSLIDDRDKRREGKSIRSLLSKFATLINPSVYTMYDTRGVESLRSFGGPGSYSSYAKFHEVFKSYQKALEVSIENSDLNYYRDLCQRQGKQCPENIFRNRLADKYLWVKQDLA